MIIIILLYSADPVIQALFQLDNNPLAETSRYLRDQMIKEVQRHPLDYGSMEAKCKFISKL